jgi:hypothetical protein
MSRSFIGRLVVTLAALVLMRRRRCYQEPTLPDRPPSGEQHSQQGLSGDRTDQAALMGAAVAAIFALVLSPGEYGWHEVVVGISLGAVLLGYYRIPKGHFTWWNALTKSSAVGAVGALCLSLIFALPLQNWLEHHGSGAYCIEVQNQDPDMVRNEPKYIPEDYYDCLGDEVNERLPWVWAAGVLVVGIPAYMLWRRERP